MKEILDRITKIAREGLELIEKSKKQPMANFIIYWNDWYSRALDILESAFGIDSEMYGNFRDSMVKPQTLERIRHEGDYKRIVATYFGSQLGMIMGYASILSDDWLTKVQDTAINEAVGSLEDAAFSLFNEGHKDAAAILARVVLEQKLHRLCLRANIRLRKKKPGIHDYTNELYKIGKLRKQEMRAIQRWGDIGNDAVHLRFKQYSERNVQEMLVWIRDFES